MSFRALFEAPLVCHNEVRYSISRLGGAGSNAAPGSKTGGSLMLKSISRAIAFLALTLVPLTSASAQEDDAKIVAGVPTEVADIVTGGSWSADKQGGFYRAF